MMALPEGSLAFGAGAVLALGAAAAVLGPLFRGVPDEARTGCGASLPEPGAEERSTAIDALREIEFDRATGKLSDTDYAELKSTYTQQALVELRARDVLAAGVDGSATAVDDAAVEAIIERYRARGSSCPTCGPRPEPDARFCSECGRFLPGRCENCGASCDKEGQRFCADCGHALVAA